MSSSLLARGRLKKHEKRDLVAHKNKEEKEHNFISHFTVQKEHFDKL